ncbi:Cj0069 family protein [Piscinibacter sp. HJYY11]|uniref:Cj0069 family protein n=1 Tax=Piscinibacter sp. HJYY11 TaxID=2801333 RepID=UPI00191EBD6C|nr:Cj0069 family protein [Piscinibacter sp. HJYY11]MBL0727175.1 Cj0069 family protein [Piscinibacter sp. HJYY11]
MADATPGRVALLYPGDRQARDRSDPAESRFAALFEALAAAGVSAEPAVYHDGFAGEVEAQLSHVDLVQVWCNPIQDGYRRDRLDALLRRVAAAGVEVSAHPDAILKLGTKDVLVATKALPFGSDVHRIDSLAQLAADLPQRLASGPRVLKQHRGHSGIGVWRVERLVDGSPLTMRLRHAERGSVETTMDLPALLERMKEYFEPQNGGHMIDQAWQARLSDGMVRAYLVEDRVAGFGHQAINALYPARPGEEAPAAGPRLYHGPELAAFQGLKHLLETGWVEQLRAAVGLPCEQLPLLWDCDFMFGERPASGEERFVLCEINVSSVSPFPPSCVQPIVDAIRRRLALRAVTTRA